MKKLILLFVLMFAMLAGPVFACGNNVCVGDCNVRPDCPTQPDVWGLFIPTTDKTVADCGNICGNAIGQYAWDGESVMALDMTTGEGFCKAPAKCLNWLLCECDSADEIEVNGKYGFTVEILTRGAKFESVASTGPPVITLAEYESKTDMCEDGEAMTRDLVYHFSDESQTVIVTKAYRRLFQRNNLYISLCDLPRIIVDNRIIPYGTPIVLRLGLYDGTIVCQPNCSRMCECTHVVAFAGCFDECCSVLPYLPLDFNWWSGIAITNLSAHDGSVMIVFVSDTQKVIKHYDVPAYGIKTIAVGSVITGNRAFAVLKTSFTSRVIGFGGDSVGCFALPATGCGGCQ
jgi:hypothetical protein